VRPSVRVSVTLNLTSRVSVRLTKDTTYLTGNEGDEGIEPCWCSLISCPLTGAWLCGWWREEFIEFVVFSFQELSLFSSARRSSVSV
ncbi:hypothetical protein GBAR_LOCUS22629, partial [Geodia barretti]